MWSVGDELRVPGDPAKSIKDFLRDELAVREPGTTAGLVVPNDWRLGSPAHVLVGDDGGPDRWPITTTPTIRIAVFGTGRDESRRIAGLCVALLLARRVPGVATIRPGMAGIADGRDEKTGAALALFTVAATARTVAV